MFLFIVLSQRILYVHFQVYGDGICNDALSKADDSIDQLGSSDDMARE